MKRIAKPIKNILCYLLNAYSYKNTSNPEYQISLIHSALFKPSAIFVVVAGCQQYNYFIEPRVRDIKGEIDPKPT